MFRELTLFYCVFGCLATVASSLELRDPDVYVSSDGGYSWRMALSGPHHYAITNSGGLLVAIPTAGGETDTIK